MKDKSIEILKSNPNIKVVNEKLWTVNFDYVLNGWIKGLKFYDTTSENFVTVAKDIIILNNTKNMCSKIIPILEDIMKLPNNKIGKRTSFCNWVRKDMPLLKNATDGEIINFLIKNKFNQVIKLYNQLSELEKQRRKNKIK